MFIPKIRTKIGGKIAGKLLDPKTKRVFTGKFVKDFKGNFFKGERITKNSEPLEFIPDNVAIESTTGLKHTYIIPTESDYKNGFLIRYFIKDAPTKKIFEVSKDDYLKERKAKKVYRKALKIQWYIKGPAEDSIINGYIYPGTKSKNQDIINQAEKELPGISSQLLKDASQFIK